MSLQSAHWDMSLMVKIAIFAALLIGSIALVVVFLTRLPPTYFHPSHDRRFMMDRHWAIRSGAIIVKNAIGVLLVLLGIVMALPGMPGQGLLTLLVGMMLVDFPGKRALEYRIIRQPSILQAVNRLRKTFSKPPLVLEEIAVRFALRSQEDPVSTPGSATARRRT